MLELLPEELVRIVSSDYLLQDDRISMVLSCKYIWDTLKKTGYLENIFYNLYSKKGDLTQLFYACKRHENTLRYLSLSNVNNPYLWLPFSWPGKVFLKNCLITSKVNNKKVNRTKHIEFYYTNGTPVIDISSADMYINFPNLSSIQVTNISKDR